MTNESDSRSDRRLTHKQAVELALNNLVARAARDANPRIVQARKIYAENAVGILADLTEAGFPTLGTVGELQGLGDYRAAVPILVRWLPEVRYLSIAHDIVRTLSVPFAKELAFPVLLRMFREPPQLEDPLRPATSEPASEYLRAVLGSALSTFTSPSTSDDLIRLAVDRSFGESRALIVSALPKTKDARVTEVLLGLLDDPTVAAFAVEALGKLKAHDAREPISAMLDSSDKNVRDQAKKALKRIDSATR
jgi:hypothetical protein